MNFKLFDDSKLCPNKWMIEMKWMDGEFNVGVSECWMDRIYYNLSKGSIKFF